MSVEASLDFLFGPNSDAQSLLESLLTERWSSGAGEWSCVPLGSDASEWAAIGGAEAVFDLLRSKLARSEIFGVQLLWNGTGIGGELLIFSEEQATFMATINRVRLDERTTDVSWYVQRLVSPLARDRRVQLERWVWSETS